MARTDHVRYEFFLPRPLSERFEALANRPDLSKSGVLVKALTAFLDCEDDAEIGQHFAQRLDQLSNQVGRIERNSNVQLESLGEFIRELLAVSPPIPERDEVACEVGHDRFAGFVEQVGRQVASGRITLDPGRPE